MSSSRKTWTFWVWGGFIYGPFSLIDRVCEAVDAKQGGLEFLTSGYKSFLLLEQHGNFAIAGLGKAGFEGLDCLFQLTNVGLLALAVLALGIAISGSFSCTSTFIFGWVRRSVQVVIVGAV